MSEKEYKKNKFEYIKPMGKHIVAIPIPIDSTTDSGIALKPGGEDFEFEFIDYYFEIVAIGEDVTKYEVGQVVLHGHSNNKFGDWDQMKKGQENAVDYCHIFLEDNIIAIKQ